LINCYCGPLLIKIYLARCSYLALSGIPSGEDSHVDMSNKVIEKGLQLVMAVTTRLPELVESKSSPSRLP